MGRFVIFVVSFIWLIVLMVYTQDYKPTDTPLDEAIIKAIMEPMPYDYDLALINYNYVANEYISYFEGKRFKKNGR